MDTFFHYWKSEILHMELQFFQCGKRHFFQEGIFHVNEIKTTKKTGVTFLFILNLMLQLDKSSIHLVEEFRGNTEWPNREGRFDLSAFSDRSCSKWRERARLTMYLAGPGLSTCSSTSKSSSRTFSPIFRCQ